MSKITAASFGKVAVLMGGWAAERDISLISGKAVHQGLLKRGVDAHAVDVDGLACPDARLLWQQRWRRGGPRWFGRLLRSSLPACAARIVIERVRAVHAIGCEEQANGGVSDRTTQLFPSC